MLDVRSFTGFDCDTECYLMIEKLGKKSAVSTIAAETFHEERFNRRKLGELKVRKEHQLKISNRFAALEILSDSEDVNKAWENIKENIETSAKESLGL